MHVISNADRPEVPIGVFPTGVLLDRHPIQRFFVYVPMPTAYLRRWLTSVVPMFSIPFVDAVHPLTDPLMLAIQEIKI